MTALNCFVEDGVAHIFADSVIYDMNQGGSVAGFVSKIIPLPHYNAALACTGMSWASIVFAGVIADAPSESFDQLATSIAPLIKTAAQRDQSAGALQFGHFELILAGMSEGSGKATAFLMRNYAERGVPAFSMESIRRFVTPEIPFPEFPFDVAAGAGLLLLEAQRATLCGVRDLPGVVMHCVGGEAVYATVSADGFSMKVLRQWPDRLGLPIEGSGQLYT